MRRMSMVFFVVFFMSFSFKKTIKHDRMIYFKNQNASTIYILRCRLLMNGNFFHSCPNDLFDVYLIGERRKKNGTKERQTSSTTRRKRKKTQATRKLLDYVLGNLLLERSKKLRNCQMAFTMKMRKVYVRSWFSWWIVFLSVQNFFLHFLFNRGATFFLLSTLLNGITHLHLMKCDARFATHTHTQNEQIDCVTMNALHGW